MKKLIRLLSVVALIALFGMMLTGCAALDEMKSNHAVLSSDRETISLQGKTFVKLPVGIPYYFNDSYSNRINVTEADVPLLLSEEFGYRGYYDSLKGIIAVNDISVYDEEAKTYLSTAYYPEEYGFSYYTEQENYEKYSQLTMDDADRIGFPHMGYSYNTAILSLSASEEILNLIKAPESWDNDSYLYAVNNYSDNIYTLFKCDNMPMSLKGTLSGYELYLTDDADVYLTSYYTEKGVKLSSSTAEDVIEKLYSR
ncbi:MAG: hypothetical protein IJW04_08275 [Ruminococcus sp.]|nr:hypothetical protein [Ruminococcus sp.]